MVNEVSHSLPNYTDLSLKEKIGQMVMVRASGYLFDHQIAYPVWEAPTAKLKSWIEDYHIGGVILLGGSAGEMSLRTQQLQSWAKFPLFIAADIEEGVGQRFTGATWFPPPMALGAIFDNDPHLACTYAQQMGAITAQEAQAIGINWILAPVADVNSNPANPVINVRAFGETATVVSELVQAFINGAQPYPVLTTAKHFPGHGDTATDSHLDLPRITHGNEHLQEVELPSFQRAIFTGVDSVMTAHLLIEAWDGHQPATLSSSILNSKLRQELDFDGLIITDALVMSGVAKWASSEEISLLAVEAGADILLMPQDPEVAINTIYEAVQKGRINPQRINASVERIWHAKSKIFSSQNLGDHNTNRPNIWQIGQPEARNVAKLIGQGSMKTGGYLPVSVANNPNSSNIIFVDEFLKADFLTLNTPAVAIPQQLGYTAQIVEQNNLPREEDLPEELLLQVFMRGNPFRGCAGLTTTAQTWFQQILTNHRIQGLIIYGSPYVMQWFEPQIPSLTPWIFSYGQMPLAQAIAHQLMFSDYHQRVGSDRAFI